MTQQGSIQWYKDMAEKLRIATDNLFLFRMKQKYNLPMEWTHIQCNKWVEEEIDRLIRKMNNSIGITPLSFTTRSVVTEDDIKESFELLRKNEVEHGEGIWGQMSKPWPWVDISKMTAKELEDHLTVKYAPFEETDGFRKNYFRGIDHYDDNDFSKKYRIMISDTFGIPVDKINVPPHNL